MASKWFVRVGEKVYGPIDAAKLKQLVADGKINQQTDVAQNNAGPWVPAEKVKGLFPISISMPPLPVAQRASNPPAPKHAPVASAEVPAGARQSTSKPNSPESFGHWYRRTVGRWNIALQIAAWLSGGYVFIPLWWAFSGNLPLIKIGKWAGIAFAGMLVVLIIMMYLDPEGMKKIREENAKGSKTENDPSFLHGFTTGFAMAKGGAVKPNSDQVDALARRAANELGDSGGVNFIKQNWKTAFWLGWNKGD